MQGDCLKKVTEEYSEDNTLYYKNVITYNKFDQPVTSEEWIYNLDGTTHYQKEKLPYFTNFGKLTIK